MNPIAEMKALRAENEKLRSEIERLRIIADIAEKIAHDKGGILYVLELQEALKARRLVDVRSKR